MNTRLKLKIGVALLAAAWLASLAAPPPARHFVWPAPPAEPRITYLRSLKSPADIGQSANVLSRFGHWITGENGQRLALQKPFGLALDEDGNLCITDTGANAVCFLDFKHKQWRRFTTAGKTALASPVAVAKRNGIFYVADSELGKVLAFHADGLMSFEITNSLVRPVGLAIAGGNLAVADSQTHAVQVFDLAGKLLFSFGKRGAGPGEFNFPTTLPPTATANGW